MRSAYDILGIPQSASEDDVKSAFRRRSKILHPDVNKSSTATQEFKQLKGAYDLLLDPLTRSNHDYALAVVETKDVEKDAIDDALEEYSMSPKKKKKKKKKKQREAEAAAEVVAQQQQQTYQPPPYIPPRHPQYEGRGNGEFEGIPGGFEDWDNLGGIL